MHVQTTFTQFCPLSSYILSHLHGSWLKTLYCLPELALGRPRITDHVCVYVCVCVCAVCLDRNRTPLLVFYAKPWDDKSCYQAYVPAGLWQTGRLQVCSFMDVNHSEKSLHFLIAMTIKVLLHINGSSIESTEYHAKHTSSLQSVWLDWPAYRITCSYIYNRAILKSTLLRQKNQVLPICSSIALG